MSHLISLIAATALYHGHAVATRNTRHFEPAGVQIIDPLS
jgi:predicted nucleic acid-binding protein